MFGKSFFFKSKLDIDLIIFGFLCLFLSGCGGSDYKESIKSYSDAVAKVKKTMDMVNQDAMSFLTDQRINRAIRTDQAITFFEEDCNQESEKCELVFNNNQEFLLPKQTLKPAILMTSLFSDYAKALSAIVDADTGDAVTQNLTKTLASIEQISTTLINIEAKQQRNGSSNAQKLEERKKQFSKDISAIGNIAAYLVGQYVETKRLDALTSAITNAQSLICEGTKLAAEIHQMAGAAYIAPVHEAFAEARDKYRYGNYKKTNEAKIIKDYNQKAIMLDLVLNIYNTPPNKLEYIILEDDNNTLLCEWTQTHPKRLNANDKIANIYFELGHVHTQLYKKVHGIQDITWPSISAAAMQFKTNSEALSQVLTAIQTLVKPDNKKESRK